MSQFRKINLSKEDLEKNPHRISPKPVEPINNPSLIKHDQEEVLKEDNKVQDSSENRSQDNINDNQQNSEVPPGEPVNNEEEESDDKGDITDKESEDQESYDETGIDFSEWYIPEGTPRWINY